MVERLKAHPFLGELFAEFLGTMVLCLFGCGVVAQVLTGEDTLGDHDSIAWAWGFGVTFGVYVSARLSGAHINPAVTLSFAVYRGFPWRKVTPYICAQTIGAFCAALLVRWNYAEMLAKADPGHTFKTQIAFSTMPGNGQFPVSQWGGLRDQIIGTALLVLLIMALTDVLNDAPKANLGPLLIGFVVVVIGMAFGADAGYAINPARDFGPRVASYLTGYADAWRDQNGDPYYWVPIVGPFIGGLVGATAYRYLIQPFLPATHTPKGRIPDADPETQ